LTDTKEPGKRGRRRKQLLNDLNEKDKILEIETGRTRLYSEKHHHHHHHHHHHQ
jgi:hypothetical protein